ncbi:uncharacterized protein BP5553_10662 [Venustampulla echinocandica]|uniref:Rhodopsin domain-containing protein n=1 Tax=Venustampulla echinocandica TaxID=2656787 RepID=A0A370T8P2_9HELO|nr:uncharacterized protein BP5553_10662 [Venustampulla echinocandica]RDL29797.1 hypothetical protein BP5553_10662 [Venustampulla echinocandica]
MANKLGGLGPTVIAVMWTETALALIFVLMRLWTRIRINRVAGWDDYLISFSWLLLMPYTAACTAAALEGFGRHGATLTSEQFVAATRAEIIGQTFCIIGIAASKASVAIFLLRITIVKWHRWILYFVMLAVSVICFFCALFDFVRCDPVAHVWNPPLPAKCFISDEDFASLSITVGVASTIADFILATLPWAILWNLQMKRREKILIASSMSLGFLAMICGIFRAISLTALNARSDYSYDTVGLILWSSTELMLTILTATIPTLRPLYNKLRGVSSRGEYDESGPGYELKDSAPIKLRPKEGNSMVTTAVGGNDNTSEEFILERGNDIVCTETVTVEYGYKGAKSVSRSASRASPQDMA